ncbi:MAG: CPBP family intramembrane metalloprotease [Rhodanobacter sp.]|nr:MAG: CPBP family intramembrane metalloprotease [Rhodanobacter sp.]TAM01998.1 MAG: CPBP family intramembrane metalloprotease [Rhodanobacter sp.]TAM40238.1 MAG: CPBP family intramembrane metalloprotease [Rhodanobacter sp.]TAN27071.1 MAG: CPBP family intramembrane metalloprotease [Rhodanobacter sp.]
MPAPRIAFVMPPGTPGWQRWLVLSPAARIVFFAAMLIGFGYSVETFVAMSGWAMKSASPLQHALANLSVQLLPVLAGYLILVKLIERRRLDELAPRDMPGFGAAGLVIGAVLFSLVVAVLWLAGSYHVTGTNPQVDWLPAVLVSGIGAGIGEEIVVRGALFRIVEEGLGTWWALLISALFFGAAHIANPAATWWSSAAIAIEAGVLLALLYAVTRSLWTCIGLHAAWNITQGTVYGIPVSGTKANGWLVSRRTGADWLSGGAFGAEASVVALTLCLMLSVILLVIALRRHSIVPSPGRRRTR